MPQFIIESVEPTLCYERFHLGKWKYRKTHGKYFNFKQYKKGRKQLFQRGFATTSHDMNDFYAGKLKIHPQCKNSVVCQYKCVDFPSFPL